MKNILALLLAALLAFSPVAPALAFEGMPSETTLAQGTVASTAVHVATVATGAFAFIDAVDLSPYLGCKLTLRDSTGRTAVGYVMRAGTGEALGSDIVDAWTNSVSYPYEVFTPGGGTDLAVENTTGIGVAKKLVGATVGALYKLVVTATITSGTPAYTWSGTETGGGAQVTWGNLATTTGAYRTGISGLNNVILYSGTASNFSIAGHALTRVTEPPATGVVIASAKGGSTQSWAALTTGFDPNAVTHYRIDRVQVAKIAGGRARGFNGTTQYLRNASSGISPGVGDFTISVWAYATQTANQCIVALGNHNAGDGVLLYADPDTVLKALINDGSGTLPIASGSALPLNTWTHFAVTFDRDGNATCYKNGSAIGTPVNISAKSGSVNTSETMIGAYGEGLAKFVGRIARVKYWDSLLSADNITADYNSGKGLRVAECTGIGTVPPAPDYGWDLEGGPAADEYAEAGAINLTQTGGVSEEEGPDAARGSIAAGLGKVSLVNGTAFFDGANVAAYADGQHFLVLQDSSGRTAGGYLKAAGGGEDLAGELIADPTFDVPGSWAMDGEWVVGGGVATATAASIRYVYTGPLVTSTGMLLKAVWELASRTAGEANVSFATAALQGASQTVPATYTDYATAVVDNGFYGLRGTNAFSGTATSLSLKQATGPSNTGATIVSTKGGTTYNWTWITPGFDPNGALGFRIYYVGY